MRLVAAAATDVGRVREGNEDSVLHDERLGIFAVADGMGGHQAGEVASATAIEALRAAIASGASIADAREKLSYDLYYVKNHGLLVDILILAATVRVVLFREGAR